MVFGTESSNNVRMRTSIATATKKNTFQKKMMASEVSCLHGSWEDGTCKCDRGYVTEFTDTELYPIYCAKKQDVFILNLRKGFEPIDILHYTTMSLTVGLATGSFLGLLFFLYTLLDACLLGRKIKKAERKLEEFKRKQIRRDSTENLNAELWYPDLNLYRCINDPEFTVEKAALARKMKKIIYAKVLYGYKPHGAGELRLYAGDTIKNVTRLNKGWCKGNLNGKFGFYPEAYAEMFQPTASDIEEDGLNDDLNDFEDAIQVREAYSPVVDKYERTNQKEGRSGTKSKKEEEAMRVEQSKRESYKSAIENYSIAGGGRQSGTKSKMEEEAVSVQPSKRENYKSAIENYSVAGGGRQSGTKSKMEEEAVRVERSKRESYKSAIENYSIAGGDRQSGTMSKMEEEAVRQLSKRESYKSAIENYSSAMEMDDLAECPGTVDEAVDIRNIRDQLLGIAEEGYVEQGDIAGPKGEREKRKHKKEGHSPEKGHGAKKTHRKEGHSPEKGHGTKKTHRKGHSPNMKDDKDKRTNKREGQSYSPDGMKVEGKRKTKEGSGTKDYEARKGEGYSPDGAKDDRAQRKKKGDGAKKREGNSPDAAREDGGKKKKKEVKDDGAKRREDHSPGPSGTKDGRTKRQT